MKRGIAQDNNEQKLCHKPKRLTRGCKPSPEPVDVIEMHQHEAADKILRRGGAAMPCCGPLSASVDLRVFY